MLELEEIKEEILAVGRLIYKKGFVAANDGNLSVLIDKDRVLATPTDVGKGVMTPEMLVTVDLEGNQLDGELAVSSEIKMHLDIYRHRSDIKAVLHAHPPVATAFAVAGIPLDKAVLPEIIITLGVIPIAPYGTPSTDEVPLKIRPLLKKHDAILLENHGALTLGTDIFDAYYKMERVEHCALISFHARQLGGERELPPREVEKLLDLRNKREESNE